MNPGSAVDGCSTVSVANLDGARAAVKHLLDLGHASVAIITGPPGNADAEARLRGYRRALREAGLEPASDLEFRGDFTESSGYETARRVLGRVPRPAAVFASNDSMAIGLLSALGNLGVRVPQEMGVVGFDDIAISRYVSPSLTTVRVDAHELGARSVRLLVSMGRAGGPFHHEVLPSVLVVRRSCGCGEGEQPSAEGGEGSDVRAEAAPMARLRAGGEARQGEFTNRMRRPES
jgi:LacI family transcriptional regulator